MKPIKTLLQKSKILSKPDLIAEAVRGGELEDWKEYRLSTSVGYFATHIGLKLDRGDFTWDGHEYLQQVYEEKHRHIAGRKATQLGLTVLAILRVLHHSLYLPNYAAALYYFPTDKDVSEFSRARVTPILENPILKRNVKDTDSIGLKRIGNGHVYFRGMRSRLSLKSSPADEIVFDELDELQDVEGFSASAARKMALERLSHSPHKLVFEISNPTFPGFGVDIAFQSSDQHYWHFKCDSCGQYSCLDDMMPKELGKDISFIKTIGKSSEAPCFECGYVHSQVQRICIYCDSVLNISKGSWIPKHPDRTAIRGYQFSQFLSKYVSAGEILHEYTTTTQPEVFYNTKIGIPFVSAENRISVDQVLALCDPFRVMADSDKEICTMGVDVGKKLHVIISKWNIGTTKRLVVFISEFDDFPELDDLMVRFNIVTCVIDGQPEQRKAREFQKRHWSKVWLNFFDDHKRGNYAWDMKQHLVSERRTEAFDASRLLLRGQPPIHDPLYAFPRQSPIILEVATHISNDAKKRQEDAETGAIWYEYVKLGINHYDLALLYDSVAWSEDLKRRKVMAAISTSVEQPAPAFDDGSKSLLERYANPDLLPEPLRSQWYAERNGKWFKDQSAASSMPVITPSGIICLTPELEKEVLKRKYHKSIDRKTGFITL